jgi:uncharacterized protein YyaL (SSP411 family)
MSYDNSELLRCYVHAFQTFADSACARTATQIVRWMDEVLSDREHGGFYASQDADISLDDDGDYFTWTRAEAAEVLEGSEFLLATQYFDIGEVGDMHHDPARNVLHINHSLESIAKQLQMPLADAQDQLSSASQKLMAARLKRQAPFVDKTLYTNWNALAISAYFAAASALGLGAARQFALKSLDRALAQAWSAETGLAHVIAYPDAATPQVRVPGMLDDYAFLVQACLDAWAATAELRYYTAALQIADAMIDRFYDPVTPGFFDAEPDGHALGALSIRRKPLQDSPTPAGNPAAASVLLRLHALSNQDRYRDIAEQTLESFGGVVEHFGLYAGTYGLAISRYLQPPVNLSIVGNDAAAHALFAASQTPWLVNKTVMRIAREQAASENLPPALAETLPHLPTTQACAIICTGRECLPPVTDIGSLLEQIASLNVPGTAKV